MRRWGAPSSLGWLKRLHRRQQSWVTNITYIRTHEGWLYLSVVIDCQFTSHDWQGFLRDHNLVCSMSRRGNCHDNAVAESFFQLLKRERIRRQIYSTRDEARTDVFNYIEMSYRK